MCYNSYANDSLMIFSPVSMRQGLQENIIAFNKKYHIDIKAVYLGTSSLAQQIKNGAKPDIFISANEYWMNYLVKKNLVLKKYKENYLFNDLVLITYEGNAVKLNNSLESVKQVILKSKKMISLAMVDAVPAGMYSKKLLTEIGLWDNIKFNVAQSSNVRLALNLVSMKELDYGLVYKSDTVQNNKVKVLYNFNNVMPEPIIYPITILNEKPNTFAFYNYLKSDNAKNIMRRWGFKVKVND